MRVTVSSPQGTLVPKMPAVPAYNFRLRLWYLISGWGAVGVIYSLAGSQDLSRATLLSPSRLDLWFTFDPRAIWMYLSFFLIVPLGYFGAKLDQARWLCRAMQLSALGAGVVFALFPTTMVFPQLPEGGLSVALLALLIRYDALQNCLPSLHVTLTVLAVMAVWPRYRLVLRAGLLIWALAIILSILQLHRHQAIDAVSGFILAAIAAPLARRLISRGQP